MTNNEKAAIYDELIRESDALQRINSRLKSQYVINIPPDVQETIDNNKKRIDIITRKFEDLLK